jgi:glycosyltransferase involved in cell wall biosynthesis
MDEVRGLPGPIRARRRHARPPTHRRLHVELRAVKRVSGSAGAAASPKDSRPRVLTLSLDAGAGYGGAETLAYEFALRLDRARFARYLCTIRAAGPSQRRSQAREARELANAGVRVLTLDQPGPLLLTPRAWVRLYSLLVRESIDIVHAHMPRASVPGALLARLARVPVVVSHEHGSALEGKRVRTFLDREVVARLSTAMIAVSESDRRNLIAHERIPADLIRVLANGIDPDESVAPGPPVLARAAGTHLIGAVGRLYPEKGYAHLIRAVALLRDSGYSVRCVILGEGPQAGELRALIEHLGVGGEVQLLGRRDDVARVLGELDVAVLCSVREGSPLAMLEYMAAGAPIVATAVGGVPELIDDGVHGLLVSGADPQALRDGIARLLDDRALAERLGAAARARRAAEFDLDGLVRRIEQLYDELLARNGRAARGT